VPELNASSRTNVRLDAQVMAKAVDPHAVLDELSPPGMRREPAH